VGRYELTPSKIYEIRSKNGVLEGQETGRGAEALRAEVRDMPNRGIARSSSATQAVVSPPLRTGARHGTWCGSGYRRAPAKPTAWRPHFATTVIQPNCHVGWTSQRWKVFPKKQHKTSVIEMLTGDIDN
jgi:hypothetical protein